MKDTYTICSQCGKASRNGAPEYWGEFKMPTSKDERWGTSFYDPRTFWLCWDCSQNFKALLPNIKIAVEKKK